MSMGINVFFNGKLPSLAALTRCFRELGFPLTFPRGTGALEKHDSGYLPMRLRGEECGIELYTHDSREELEEDFEIDIDPRFTRSAYFRWSSNADEGVVALCFAGALAKLLNGAVLDVDGETILTADQIVGQAREELRNTAPPPKRRTTRPADIRHYLKPLLEQRSDLALVGRYLFIRPVRHLLRGAFFDRTSDRHEFRLWSICEPLYGPNGGFGHILHDGAFEVWQPHFQPLLLATLAEDVFEPLGRITTLTDFSSRGGSGTPFLFARVTSLVLAGECDRAAALVKETERKYEHLAAEIRQHWKRLLADIEGTCAEYRTKEAEAVKALKLERFWEPSPFPVELPASERESKSTEPFFVPRPWLTRPPWLWQPPPEAPGSFCYAKDVLDRANDIALLVALTPDEAEERHREREGYVLAARISDGLLALVRRSTIYDRQSPEERRTTPYPPDISISLHGRTHRAFTRIWDSDRETGICHLTRFSVRDRATSRKWQCQLNLREGKKDIWDDGSGMRIHTTSVLTDEDREVAACPIPAFGEYGVAVERFRAALRVAGLGDVS